MCRSQTGGVDGAGWMDRPVGGERKKAADDVASIHQQVQREEAAPVF